MRVVGQVDGRRLGRVDWLVRLRCAPDAASRIASTLARRDDTAWVAVASGGTEITCITRTPDERGSLLLEKLSRTPRIDSVTAHCLLRGVAGTSGWAGRTSALTPEEIAAVRQPQTPPRAAHRAQTRGQAQGRAVIADGGRARLSPTAWALLGVLASDGRAGYPALAAATGWSQSTVRRRLPELRRDGVLYFDVDIDPALLGYGCQAALWPSVAPAELTSVTQELAGHLEIGYAAATTGATNITAFAVCRDRDAFYDYLATRIGALRGVDRIETSLIGRHFKRAGAAPAVPPAPAHGASRG